MTLQNKIRILLVDDHLVVRKGLLRVLNAEDDIEVLGEAENGEEALFLSQKLKPGIILIDVKMDGLGGIETTKLISQYHASARIIGLSTFSQQDVITSMMEAGASGYLLKDVSATELSTAIRQVHNGEIVIPKDDQTQASTPANLETEQEDREKPQLGEQQKKVLALMTKGFTNPEIADHLGISSPTARYHVSAILRKLDVSNRSEAVALAVRMNLVSKGDF